MENKPLIGVTMGDPFGIGPELVLKALAEPSVYEVCRPVVIGSRAPLVKAIESVGSSQSIKCIESPADAVYGVETVNLMDMDYEFRYEPGAIKAENGAIVIKYMRRAYELIADGVLEGTASAPCNKEAMKKAGSPYTGATELFGHFAGDVRAFAVALQDNYFCFNVTEHQSLRKALDSLNCEKIGDKIHEVCGVLRGFGYESPRLVVSGINPHCGDGGTMGTEEIDFVIPAVEAARAGGIDILGPVPADAVFIKAVRGERDAVITMFHDHGGIGSKLIAAVMNRPTAVLTANLPFIRTTVAHGTAYDIAYQNKADHRQMRNCIITAGRFALKMRKK